MNTRFVSGVPIADANPVISKINSEKSRCIRIIQCSLDEAEGDEGYLVARIEHRSVADPNVRRGEWELVLNCVLSTFTVGAALALCGHWVRMNPIKQIEQYINRNGLR
jgi:hypothetical protein